MDKVSTCIIEENPLMRVGIKSLLNKSRFDVRIDIANFSEVKRETLTQNLTIFSAANVSDMAVQTLLVLRKAAPDMRIVVLSEKLDRSDTSICFSSGADGVLLKGISTRALISSLELIMAGEKVFPTSMVSMITTDWACWQDNEDIDFDKDVDFSPRAIEIIRGLAGGGSNKLIARNLGITESTVKVHLKSILRKLELANRTQVALWAVSNGIRPAAETSPSSVRAN